MELFKQHDLFHSISSLALSKNQRTLWKMMIFFSHLICDLFMFLVLYAFELPNNYSYVARRRADLSYILWRGDYLKCKNERKHKNSMKGFTTENVGPRPSSNPGYTLFLIMHTPIFFFFFGRLKVVSLQKLTIFYRNRFKKKSIVLFPVSFTVL